MVRALEEREKRLAKAVEFNKQVSGLQNKQISSGSVLLEKEERQRIIRKYLCERVFLLPQTK
jgi:hypothetical protein